jgi:AcrR family transcriptional regulator
MQGIFGSLIYFHTVICKNGRMPTLKSARERARAEVTAEILSKAREHLAVDGPSGLSLRAVARDLGLVASAVYRYFENRDALLTALIVDSYNSLGDAVDASIARTVKRSPHDQWVAAAEAIRDWALAHRHEYALLYGSPVPGYAAPQDTVVPGTRVSLALVKIVADAKESGRLVDGATQAVPRVLQRDLRELAATVGVSLSTETLYETLLAWTQLFGLLSFEVFGQMVGIVADHAAFFRQTAVTTASRVGL